MVDWWIAAGGTVFGIIFGFPFKLRQLQRFFFTFQLGFK